MRRDDQEIIRALLRGGINRNILSNSGHTAARLALSLEKDHLYHLIVGYDLNQELIAEARAITDFSQNWN